MWTACAYSYSFVEGCANLRLLRVFHHQNCMFTHLPSFNSLLKLHVAILSIGEQLGLAATFVHSKLFFILSDQTKMLKFPPPPPPEVELCQSLLCEV